MVDYSDAPEARLDEFDKEEWWDVCRSVRPDWTREQFEDAWGAFQLMKELRQIQ